MKKRIVKKMLAFLLVLTCLVTAIPLSSQAKIENNSGVDVEIVSFMRGTQKDLRSSELLEAKVTGYEGNVRDLTYKWTNALGTYLYVYNSPNMYYINNTDGEMEVYNDKVSASANMSGRAHKYSFQGEGYCWASVYGASIEKTTALNGSITVEVYEGDKLIASDTHEGKVTVSGSFFSRKYTYSGFVLADLSADMDNVTIGIFEGDKRNVKDLLGESAILHITCEESFVQKGSIVGGNNNQFITLTTESGDYYITGKQAGSSTTGDAKVNLTIEKGNCKFHHSDSATATTTVFVFPKPTTTTTETTLTLTGKLDDRCEYFVAGVKGERKTVNGVTTITFTGLKPNTEYAVEVHAHYNDAVTGASRIAYAYVYDTTKPIYNGTVEVILNGSYDTATATATGTRVNIEDVKEGGAIYVKELNGQDFINLPQVKDADGNKVTGVYSRTLDTGTYYIYSEDKDSALIDSQELNMSGADRTRYVFFNSVQYKDGDVNLGIHDEDLGTDYYVTGSSAITREALSREGLVFIGWEDENGNVYPAGTVFTDHIHEPVVLTAKWEKGINVYVNVTVDHYHNKTESYYNGDDRHYVSFDLMSRTDSGADFEDVKTLVEINWNGEDDTCTNGSFDLGTEDDGENNLLKTIYTNKEDMPVLANVRKGSEYSVEVTKRGYEIKSVTSSVDADGNVTLDVLLEFDPKNTDLKFAVELDEDAQKLVEKHPEYKPVAVHVKVLSWYNKGYTKHGHTIPDKSWAHISQHHDTYVTLTFGENNIAEGSYPVWMHDSNQNEFYRYRIKVVSYVLSDGTTIHTSDVEGQQDVQYISDGERYLATISVAGADDTNIPDAKTSLHGAYFTPATDTAPVIQNGTPKATISIRTHNVKFNPNSGVLNVQGDDTQYTSENPYLLKDQIKVPDFSAYVPYKEGGYIFEGWYLADEKGNVTSTQVLSGDELTKDITLIAKWRDPITVEGTIAVDTLYTVDDTTIEIFDHDRVKSLNVILQRTLHNGYTETISHAVVPVTYTEGKTEGFGAYEFKGVPNDTEHPYRVSIISANYVAVYQNEPESLNNPTDYSAYNAESYNAVLGDVEPEVANVNAYLHYEPTTFPLIYRINAKAIGERFRPKKADTLILCDNDTNIAVNPQRWDVIGQMINADGTLKGQKTDISNNTAVGENSYHVWSNKPDGIALYDYAIRLNSYVPYNSNEFSAVDEKTVPFYINYNGSARYSAISGQTQILEATLVPRLYTVTLDVNFLQSENDHVENMDEIGEDSNGFYIYHTWSFDTPVTAKPQRKGYKFLGWFDKNGNQVTAVDASVCENITLTAKWEKLFEVRFHANNDAVSEDLFRTYYEQGYLSEDKLTLESDGRIKAFYDLPQLSYLDNNKYIFKGWYLDKDNHNDTRPINWETTTYTADTDVYAHWIVVGEVEKHADDKKDFNYPKEGFYPEYDLAGVQIRTVEIDETDHYGKAGTGLRFLTILSDNVYNQINAISPANKNGAEYGFAVAKTSTAQKNSDGRADYEIQYKGDNVNGTDTNEEYFYVVNMKCSGVSDHKYYKGSYRIYTAVITYDGIEGDALTEAHNSPLTARSYMRYNDANGLYRTYYNNYTGTNTFSGCSASYSDVYAGMGLSE